MSRKPKLSQKPDETTLSDAAPFPGRLPRKITDKEMRLLGLDEVAKKIPEGRIVMIMGTRKS